jgi:hypothetical protein
MEQDRRTIGLTPANQATLSEIEERGWFLEGQDIARFAMAYAIKNKTPEGTTTETETRWAAGNFDDTGEIRMLLAALYPTCSTPVRLMEHLVNEGLQMLAPRIRSADIGPAELMTDDSGTAPSG